MKILFLDILPSSFKELLELLAVLGALASFVWGIYVWRKEKQKERKQVKTEAIKPFLEKQFSLYIDAVKTVSEISESYDEDNPQDIKDEASYSKFWQLFYGELALVENKEVAKTMIDFRNELKEDKPSKQMLRLHSLMLTYSCKRSLDKSWNINVWTDPDSGGFKGQRRKRIKKVLSESFKKHFGNKK